MTLTPRPHTLDILSLNLGQYTGVLTEDFSDFHRSHQADLVIERGLGHDHFLSDLLQFFIPRASCLELSSQATDSPVTKVI
jgi:hypothetical protein